MKRGHRDSETTGTDVGNALHSAPVQRRSAARLVGSAPYERSSAAGAVVQRKETGAGEKSDPVSSVRGLLGSTPAASSLSALPASGGAPLGESVQARFEGATGRALDPDVRVHSGENSRRTADALGARAFTTGRDIHVGSAGSAADDRLMLHEATHTVQQAGVTSSPQRQGLRVSSPADSLERQADAVADAALSGGAAPVTAGAASLVQRDAVDKARKKLSYGAFDWAITDSEAMEALALLGSMPDMGAAVTKLGKKYVERLLDNLPGSAKSGPVYTQLIVALGPAGVLPYVHSLLSYGVFDWVITDNEVGQVFNIFGVLPAPQKQALLVTIETDKRLGRLIDNANSGHHALYVRPWITTLPKGEALTGEQKRLVKGIFDATDDGELETLKLCLAQRFDIVVGPSQHLVAPDKPKAWDAPGLRRVYPIYESLPPAHVSKNAELTKLGRFKEDGGVSGQYWQDEVSIAYGSGDMGDKNQAEKGDPLHGVNRFNKVIRHETGHAVDEQMGWTTGAEPANASRGGWKQYGAGYLSCATDMVADSNGGITTDLTGPQRTDVLNAMVTAMTNRSAANLEKDIKAFAWFAGLAKAKQTNVLADTALGALKTGLATPWYNATGGGPHVGTHIYQESYANSWNRYEHTARARKMSLYQFRGPRDWFAESYAAYYEPDKRGRGAVLADKDANTKVYFDNHVHTLATSR